MPSLEIIKRRIPLQNRPLHPAPYRGIIITAGDNLRLKEMNLNIKRRLHNIMVTGGAGFIGVNFIRNLLSNRKFSGRIVNVDALTYAGNTMSLPDVPEKHEGRYFFLKADICDTERIYGIMKDFGIDTIINFAAQSHVDRSIINPSDFVGTNIFGTFSLLEAARKSWKPGRGYLFHQVSTDEAYGTLGSEGSFSEASPYSPRSPYSASKASADLLAKAYYHTYGLPVTISNSSNNYGPYQFPEKLVPLMINNMLERKPLPIYGDGKQVRDWIYVEDHVRGIWLILEKGIEGESYNIGGGIEHENIRLVHLLCRLVAEETGAVEKDLRELIIHVKDRPGHDRRYSMDCGKIIRELGWQRRYTLKKGLAKTVKWYIDNTPWVENVRNGEYLRWMDENYGNR